MSEKVFHRFGLTAITIPEGVTSIGNYAFDNCTALKKVIFEDGSETLSLGYNNYYSSDTGQGLFYDCPLESVYLGRNLSYNTSYNYGYSPFYNKTRLTSVVIGDCVTSIGSYAFYECSSLTAIVLPKNLEYIYSEAFANCSELLDVYCYAEKVPSTEADAFDGLYIEYATLHVPASALNAYKTTSPWSNFGTIVSLTDEEMGIKNSELNIQDPELIYDLRGRRVEKAEKGIYIVNGKKTVIK